MGNSNSLNKAARLAASSDGKWANDIEVLAVIRGELEQQDRRHSTPSKRSSRRSTNPDKLSMDEIRQLHKLVLQLNAEEEGQDLLKRFVERQADLPLDPALPPLQDIQVVIPEQKKRSNGSRAA